MTKRKNPTGSVNIKNQRYVPVPVPSFHMDPPWKMDVTKARRIGEMAKIKPTRMNGKLFMGRRF